MSVKTLAVTALLTVLLALSLAACTPMPPGDAPPTATATAASIFTNKGSSQPTQSRSATSVVVAASNAPASVKTLADYVAIGTADNVPIQEAINGLPPAGGVVELSVGDFCIDAK